MTTLNRTDPRSDLPFDGLPGEVPDGSAILLAKPAEMTDRALALALCARYSAPDASHLVLTSDADAERTIEQFRSITTDPTTSDSITSESVAGRLGVVDASETQQPSAPFQKHPTISLPNPNELTRIVLALQQLESTLSTDSSTINVVARSLSPMLEATQLGRVTRVLDQLVDRQRSAGGVAVFGLEYTRHDNRTMAELTALVDAVVWVESDSNGLHLDFEPVRNR